MFVVKVLTTNGSVLSWKALKRKNDKTMSQITDDFSERELSVIQDTLRERYGQTMTIQEADAEIRLSPDDRELTLCPVVLWQATANFVLFKTGKSRYRCQFFYRPHEQFGTSIKEFDNIGDCVIALLKAQETHEKP